MKRLYYLWLLVLSCCFVSCLKQNSHNIASNTSQDKLTQYNTSVNFLTDTLFNEDSLHQVKKAIEVSPYKPNDYGFVLVSSEVININKELFVYEFSLPDLSEYKAIIIEYDVRGIKNSDALFRRINDHASIGGAIIIEGKEWYKKREEIPSQLFHKGNNKLAFQGPDDYENELQIKNFSIKGIKSDSELKLERYLHINQQEPHYTYNQYGYIQGFVGKKTTDTTPILKVNGQEVEVDSSGIFQTMVTRSNSSSEPFFCQIAAIYPDGAILCDSVEFVSGIDYNYAKGRSFEKNEVCQQYNPTDSFSLSLDAVQFYARKSSLEKATTISITSLRAIDMPLVDSRLSNVTANKGGYRFLPNHTIFTQDVSIVLPYDTTLIPNGFNANDIYPFYYDEKLHKWIVEKRDSINTEKQLLYASTNHFTDYIAGILKVPESSEVAGYTPTSIKDLQAAHPHNSIGSFSVPQANNRGSANSSMNLWIPQGRQGMQPSLQLSYNSAGGDGWLGTGWDIPFSSIEVETRWGVPLYDPEYESETYLLDGQTLVTGHYDANRSLQLDKPTYRTDFKLRQRDTLRFYRRVEGSFQKIERIGSDEQHYYWCVTDKSGTKYYYGKYVTSKTFMQTSDRQAILYNDKYQIGKWMLTEMVDVNGNSVVYTYNTHSYNGAKQIVLKQIDYTNSGTRSHIAELGAYTIKFNTDTTVRKDIQYNGRKGFLECNAYLLDNIQVYYHANQDTTQMRVYYFNYKIGSYGKTLLASYLDSDPLFEQTQNIEEIHQRNVYDRTDYIANLNEDNNIPLLYEFSYYKANDSYESKIDTINLGSIKDDNHLYKGTLGNLGASKSFSWGLGGDLNVGYYSEPLTKFASVGGGYNYNNNHSEGLLTYVDINGDGYPDQIYKQKDELYYRLYTIDTNGKVQFASPQKIEGIKEFNRTESYSNNGSIEGQLGATFGFDFSGGNSLTNIFFSDVDGDGLIDIVNNKIGAVYFNRPIGDRIAFRNEIQNDTLYIGNSKCGDNYIMNNGEVDMAVFAMANCVQRFDSLPNECKCGHEICSICETYNKSIRDHCNGYYYISKEDGERYYHPSSSLPKPQLRDNCISDINKPLYVPNIQSVRRWIAPYTGVVSINSLITLNPIDTSLFEQLGVDDGIKYCIQKGANNQLKIGELTRERQTQDSIDLEESIEAGTALYFIVNSNERRAFDIFDWDINIQYSIVEGDNVSVNEKNTLQQSRFIYNSKEDFALFSEQQDFLFPYNGNAKCSLQITSTKPILEPINIDITGDHTYHSAIPLQNQNIDFTDIILFNQVQSTDSIHISISTPGDIDWSSLDVKARIYYDNITSVINDINIPTYNIIDSTYTFDQYAAVNKRTTPYEKVASQLSTLYTVPEAINYYPLITWESGTTTLQKNGQMRMTIKNSSGILLEDMIFNIINDTIVPNNFQYVTNNTPNVYIDFYIDDKELATKISKVRLGIKDAITIKPPITVASTSTVNINSASILPPIIGGTTYFEYYNTGLYTPIPTGTIANVGTIYRGWSYFGYKPTGDDISIDESKLVVNYPDLNQLQIISDANSGSNANSGAAANEVKLSAMMKQYSTLSLDSLENISNDSIYNPLNGNLFVLIPDYKNDNYTNYTNLVYLGRNQTSHVNDNYTIDRIISEGFPLSQVKAGEKVRTISKKSASKDFSARIGAPILGISRSSNTTRLLSDYMDINGDRYPDIVGPNNIQFSKPQGGLSDLVLEINVKEIDKSESNSLSLNGSPLSALLNKIIGSNPKIGKACLSSGSSISKGTTKSEHTWIDINGDGLPDMISTNGQVSLGLGYGVHTQPITYNVLNFMQSSSVSAGVNANISTEFDVLYSISGGISYGNTHNFTEYALMDVNGDGLQDVIYYDNSTMNADLELSKENAQQISLDNSNLYVKYNTGGGFSEAEKLIYSSKINTLINYSNSHTIGGSLRGTASIPIFFVKLALTASGSTNMNWSVDKTKLMDFNNDGYPDIVTYDNDALYVCYAQPQKDNLLKRIETPINGRITFDYAMTPQSSVSSPSRRWEMSECEVSEMIDVAGVHSVYSTYEYSDANYDRYERTDMGYGKVVTKKYNNDNPQLSLSLDDNLHLRSDKKVHQIVEEHYHNDSYFNSGLKYETLLADSLGDLLTTEFNSYQSYELETGKLITEDNKYCSGTAWPGLERTENVYYDNINGTQIATYKAFTYGAFGNVMSYENNNNGEPIVLVIDKYHIDTLNYFVDKILSCHYTVWGSPHKYIKTGIIDTTYNRYRSIIYNNIAETSLTYDQYGNITQVKQPQNIQGQRMQIDITIDSVLHALPIEVRNSFNLKSQTDYRYDYALPIKTTDMAAAVMQYGYDERGRLAKIVGPYENDYTIEYEYWDRKKNGGNLKFMFKYVFTRHYNPDYPKQPIEVLTVADGFGRIAYTSRNFISNGKDSTLYEGIKLYDYMGNVLRETTAPYTEQYGTGLLGDNQSQKFIFQPQVQVHTYDELGRQLTTTMADGTMMYNEYTIEADASGKNRFCVTTRDANGNTIRKFSNLAQQTTQTISNNGFVTQMNYNALGQLTSSIDPEGVSVNYEYDIMGRLMNVDHPAFGVVSYQYNGALSDVLEESNNQGSVLYEYDMNRLKHMYTSDNSQDVYYEYGGAGSGNGSGRLVRMQDATGVQEYEYGKLGEVVALTRTHLLPDKLLTHRTEWEYDSYGRTKYIVYPDGEKVGYSYNHYGQLKSVIGDENYVDNIAYDVMGRKTQIYYGNGSVAHYGYDTLMQRLSNYELLDAGNKIMYQSAYTYDNVGQITDLMTNYQTNIFNGTINHQYMYDGDYRLIGANGHGDLDYDLLMNYSNNGNIIKKQLTSNVLNNNNAYQNVSDISYVYKQNPYQVEFVTGSQYCDFEWDKIGNITKRIGDKINDNYYWSLQSRMMAFNSDKTSMTAQYRYDAGGERDLKLTGKMIDKWQNGVYAHDHIYDRAVLYASELFTVHDMGYSKHYFIEGERIAASIGGRGEFLVDPTDPLKPISTNNIDDLMKNYQINMEQYYVNEVNSPDLCYWAGTPLTETLWNSAGGGEVFYYHADHLGSGTILTNPHGEASQVLSYMPFGEELLNVTDQTYSTPYRFTGHEKDEESGLHYAHARYLSTDLSIFLSVDPMYMKYPSLTPYHYCGNNPVMRVDVSGDTIAVLVSNTGGAGHMAILIQETEGENKGKWALYSKNGNKTDTKYASISGSSSHEENDRGTNQMYDSPEHFLSSEQNGKDQYTQAYVIPTTEQQDSKIAETALSEIDKPYNFFTSNCMHSVQAALRSGGLKDGSTVNEMQSTDDGSIMSTIIMNAIPRLTFNRIVQNNPNGQLIKAKKK